MREKKIDLSCALVNKILLDGPIRKSPTRSCTDPLFKLIGPLHFEQNHVGKNRNLFKEKSGDPHGTGRISFGINRGATTATRDREQLKRIAEFLGVHSTMITHVFRGDQNFSVENAIHLADYLGFNDDEAEYFLELVQFERAGTSRAQQFIKRKILKLQKQALHTERQLSHRKELGEAEKAMFYSEWHYVAIQLNLFNPKINTVEDLAQALNIDVALIRRCLEFLIRMGIVTKEGHQLVPQIASTHLDQTHPLVFRHHGNWRQKALAQHRFPHENELHYTSPVMLEMRHAVDIKRILLEVIRQAEKKI